MADKTLLTKFILRNDTFANWETVNPVLEKGEVGIGYNLNENSTDVDYTSIKMKVGDGKTVWNVLPYFGGSETHVLEVTLTNGQSHTDAIAAKVTELGITLAKGDIAIVKETISGDKQQYTAYVFKGEAWAAMDGNYSAENVYFEENITLAGGYTSVGNVNLSDKTLSVAGMSIKDAFTKIFTKELNPNVTAIGATLTPSTKSISGEVGSKYTLPTVSLSVSQGTFPYGGANKDADGNLINKVTSSTSSAVAFTSMTITNDKTSDTATSTNSNDTITMTLTTANMNAEANKDLIIKDSSLTYNYSASAVYPAFGKYPEGKSEKYALTNLGNEFTGSGDAEYNAIKNGGTITKSGSTTVSGWRNYWYGFVKDKDFTKLHRLTEGTNKNKVTEGNVYLTAGGKAVANGALPTLTSAAGDVALVVLVPNSADKIVTEASLPDSLNAPVTFSKTAKAVQIHGLDGYTAVDYDVLYYAPPEIPAGTRFNVTIGTDTTN